MKARICKDNFSFREGLWIYYEQGGKLFVARPVKLTFEEIDPCSPSDGPTINISGSNSKEFFESLVEELNEAGVKSPAKEKVFGLYEAQSEHLKDLRKLLKLNEEQS